MPSTLESIVLSALVVLLLFWWAPRLRSALALSRHAPSDWGSVIGPLIFVVLFVIGLILLT
jgi:hypothetical protein